MADAVEMPRAKRLKLLREAKLRKERGETAAVDKAAVDTAEPVKKEAEEPIHEAPEQETDDKADGLVEKVAQAEEDAKTEDESEDELLNLAPKRANWDMERDIAPMLRKLERRTQHAIVEILREKMAAEQQEESEDED